MAKMSDETKERVQEKEKEVVRADTPQEELSVSPSPEEASPVSQPDLLIVTDAEPGAEWEEEQLPTEPDFMELRRVAGLDFVLENAHSSDQVGW